MRDQVSTRNLNASEDELRSHLQEVLQEMEAHKLIATEQSKKLARKSKAHAHLKYKYDSLVNRGEEMNNSSAKQEMNKSNDKQTAEGKMSYTDEIPLGKLRQTALRVSQMAKPKRKSLSKRKNNTSNELNNSSE